MQPYLRAARRYQWVLATIVLLIWGAGFAAAYIEYKTTYEAEATIWVLQPSAELAATTADSPDVPLIQTVATQQVELLNQLLKTRSFVRDVVDRTSLRPVIEAAQDDRKALDDVRKRFSVRALGTNMLGVSYTAHDPQTPYEMVVAVLAMREARVAQARVAGTTAVSALYQKEFEVAQAQALDAQRKLTEFNETHAAPVNPEDEHLQSQLRLTLDFAQVRLGDLKGRIDRAVLAPAIADISGMEFQVVDEPRLDSSPRGGDRSATVLAAAGIAAGLALAVLLTVVATLLADHIGGPVDVGRLAPATLFATVPRIGSATTSARGGLRATLAAAAFGERRATPREAGR
jgi:uncharacterized protein involved in exopolysaccharide biosynthesis